MDHSVKIREIVECIYKGKLTNVSEDIKAILKSLAEDAIETKKVELAKVLFTEEKKKLTELSKGTLGSYIKKATSDVAMKSWSSGGHFQRGNYTKADKRSDQADKRTKGINTAVNKLTKEDQVEEGLVKDRNKGLKNKAVEKLGVKAFMKSGGSLSKKQMGRKELQGK